MKNIQKDNLIFGRNPVKEAIKHNSVVSLFLVEGFHDSEILNLIRLSSLQTKIVSNNELNQMCQGVHQGIAAIIKPYQTHSLEEIIFKSKKEKNPIIVMLDGINDPHNFGAILRCCDIFGVIGVVIAKHNQVPLNATVAKTSAGAINYVPVAQVGSLNQTIQKLKDNGFWVVSTDGSATIDYSKLTYDFPVALVIGSEGSGVSSLVIKNSDYVVKIPQYGHVNSLNASVAAGILLSRIRS